MYSSRFGHFGTAFQQSALFLDADQFLDINDEHSFRIFFGKIKEKTTISTIFVTFVPENSNTMKKSILIAMAIIAFGLTANAQEKKAESKVKHLTYNEFLKKVWDFEKDPNTFNYKGKLPAIIDFYADWCGPCRRVAPIMERLAEEYDGKLLVYKINTDKERELASAFQVRSIPMVLFVPMEGQPMMSVGAMQEQEYKKVVEEQLLK